MSVKTENSIALEERFGAHNYHPLDVVIERAKVAGFGMWKGTSISTAWRPTQRSIKGTVTRRSWKPCALSQTA